MKLKSSIPESLNVKPIIRKQMKEIHCPHCGNADPGAIELLIGQPAYITFRLYRDEIGIIRTQSAHPGWYNYVSHLYCRKCHQQFENPGIIPSARQLRETAQGHVSLVVSNEGSSQGDVQKAVVQNPLKHRKTS